MSTDLPANRWLQLAAWLVFSLFIIGFFFSLVGAWTGAILGVWFVSTQRPMRGFLWMAAITLVFSLPSLVHSLIPLPNGLQQAATLLGVFLLGVFLHILPFTFHRLASPRLPGFSSTLAFPLAATAVHTLIPLTHSASTSVLLRVLTCWFAAVVIWLWNHEFSVAKIRRGAILFASVCAVVLGYKLFLHFGGTAPVLLNGQQTGWICLGGALLVAVWALFRRTPSKSWQGRQETLARLQSPFTGSPLQVENEEGREVLLSSAGERFPIRQEMPIFLHSQDLTGDNGKYNHVYETIGGFYDDTQRVFCALNGFNRDVYFRSYMDLLEVWPGDTVLETSVGTGLNLKYLPKGVKFVGLDLSPEMLVNCQSNLRRWQREADLIVGNAESLPFADASFDVVFHVGGINFFNDRAKAIEEMIRVAKPGSLLLIADETEKHVKEIYERQPGGAWRNRKQPVSPPVDLVPTEMQEVHLELLRDDQFYALTFRKPAKG